MKANKYSIRWKLFGFFISFVIVMLVLLWLFQIVFLEEFYKGIKMRSIENTAQSITTSWNNTRAINLDDISENNEFSIKLVRRTGVVFQEVRGTSKVVHIPQHSLIRVFDLASENSKGVYIQVKSSDVNPIGPNQSNGPFITYAKVMDSDMMIIIQAYIFPVRATTEALSLQLIIISIILVLLAIILTFVMSKKIARPLVNINDSAKELALGIYDKSFEGYGYKEVYELSETLNYTRKKLSEVEKMQEQLMANVSHDLRTPLTMITGYGEMIRDIPNENNVENIQVIIDEAKYLNTMVDDILNLSRIKQDINEINLESLDIVKEVEELLKRYKNTKAAKDIEINFNRNKDSIIVSVDKIKIMQCIYNLLNNAINHSEAKTPIDINIDETDSEVLIEIIDYGKGIPAEDLDNIWKKYYATKDNHQRGISGTGLGLAIVKEIFEKHSFDYGVESVVNTKTRFWFKIKK